MVVLRQRDERGAVVTKSGPAGGGVVCVIDVPGSAGCAGESSIRRTWTAVDTCGNRVSYTQTITVRDTTPPTIACPAPATVQCASQVPAPAPGSVAAADTCPGGVTVAHVGDALVNQTCPNRFTVQRTYRATDACGNSATCMQLITVNDTTPPVVQPSASDSHCLWPPNHGWVCYTRANFHHVVTDNCPPPPTWKFAGCASNQSENDIGDGNTGPDCLVSPDSSQFCVRAERQGTDLAGRTYTVTVEAVDACGNTSQAAVAAIHVPHDQREHPECLKTTQAGRRPNQGLPW